MNIRELILRGEGTTLDFKKTITSSEKIAKSLVAFANNKGGVLLIGVSDDGNIVGVKSEDEERYMITRAAHQYCKPAIEPKFEEIYINHKIVLAVTIDASDTKPHYALDSNKEWWAYYRVADKTVLASKIVLDMLKDEQRNTGKMIVYSALEKQLFSYLELQGRITLRQFTKLSRISNKKAQKLLVNLITTGILQLHLSEKEEYFTFINLK
jgi:predicted HTH transcriptional regulator